MLGQFSTKRNFCGEGCFMGGELSWRSFTMVKFVRAHARDSLYLSCFLFAYSILHVELLRGAVGRGGFFGRYKWPSVSFRSVRILNGKNYPRGSFVRDKLYRGNFLQEQLSTRGRGVFAEIFFHIGQGSPAWF